MYVVGTFLTCRFFSDPLHSGRMKKLLVLLWLGACGFSPLYSGKTVQNTNQPVLVAPISGIYGIEMRQDLREALAPVGDPAQAVYRLEVSLQDPRVDLRGLRQDATATWGTVIAKAHYKLLETSSGKVVLEDDETAFASYEVLSSVYSSMTATENSYKRATETLGQQILSHIQSYLKKHEQ